MEDRQERDRQLAVNTLLWILDQHSRLITWIPKFSLDWLTKVLPMIWEEQRIEVGGKCPPIFTVRYTHAQSAG